MGIVVWIHICVFYSGFTCLHICFCSRTMLLLLLCLCGIVWSQILWYLQCCSFLLSIALAVCGLLCFQMNVVCLFVFFFYCCAGWGVHCSIYKGSYNKSNILYLNSAPPLLLFIPPLNSWNTFSRYHFYTVIHVHILFSPYSSSYPFPCHIPPLTCAKPPPPCAVPVLNPCSLIL
jgi:hypothetical protein